MFKMFNKGNGNLELTGTILSKVILVTLGIFISCNTSGNVFANNMNFYNFAKKELIKEIVNNKNQNINGQSESKTDFKTQKVLDISDTYNKYITQKLTEREKEVAKKKELILNYISSLNKKDFKVDPITKQMIEIEEQLKKSKGVILLKLEQKKMFYKLFRYKNGLYLLVINPILLYEGDDQTASVKYKEFLINTLKQIASVPFEQKGKEIKDTIIGKKLKEISKTLGLTDFYKVINLQNLSFRIQVGKENQAPILNLKKLNMAYYNTYFYLPERLKYLVDNKSLYFYIPVDDSMVENQTRLQQVKKTLGYNNLNFWNNMCFYVNPTGPLNELYEGSFAFCGLGKDFNGTNKAIQGNGYYNVNLVKWNDLMGIKHYNKAIIQKRPAWTVIIDVLISMLGILLAVIFYRKVVKEEKKETITEKEEL